MLGNAMFFNPPKITKHHSFLALISVLLSIAIHGIFFWFILKQSGLERKLEDLWSGGGFGGKDHITFVELAKIDVHGNEQTPPPKPEQQSKINTLKQKIHPVKTGVQQKNKTQPGTADKTTIKSAAGTGNSDTPNSGHGQGLDPGEVKQYASHLATIRKKIMRNKTYPSSAKDKGLTGAVKLAFKINPDGSLSSVRVLKSSGVSILDESALTSVRKSVPLPFYPETIAITLEYQLIE